MLDGLVSTNWVFSHPGSLYVYTMISVLTIALGCQFNIWYMNRLKEN